MAFVAVKCNQCGANLEIDDSRTSGVCPYCKTAFVVDQAAQGTFSHGDRSAGGAGDYDPEDAYRRGKAFLRLKDQKHAQSVAEEMLLMRPDSPLGHLLYLELITREFSAGPDSQESTEAGIKAVERQLAAYEEAFGKFRLFASQEQCAEVEARLRPLLERLRGDLEQKRRSIRKIDRVKLKKAILSFSSLMLALISLFLLPFFADVGLALVPILFAVGFLVMSVVILK